MTIKLEKIDLIIDLQSKLRNCLILRKIAHNHFYSRTYNFKFCTKKKNILNHLENLSLFFKSKFLHSRFYIRLIDSKYKTEAKRLLPDNNYVGFSLTQGNVYREKKWNIKNFINLAKKIEEKNKQPVFFIEKENIKLINEIKIELPNALFPELHSKISCPAFLQHYLRD